MFTFGVASSRPPPPAPGGAAGSSVGAQYRKGGGEAGWARTSADSGPGRCSLAAA